MARRGNITERACDQRLEAMTNLNMKSFWRGALDHLAKIELQSYDDTLGADIIASQFRQCRVCVASEDEAPEEVVGFYIMFGQEDEVGRIDRFCVKPSWRRRYVGSCMMDDLLQDGYRLSAVACSVDEYNVPAQLFLNRHSFTCKSQSRHPEANSDNYLFVRSFRGESLARNLQVK